MAEWKDQGLVLKTGHFHEADLWLKMLFREHGLITVFAFGGARSKRRFCGCLDLLNTLNCIVQINRTGEYHILKEASLVRSPAGLRTSWRKMGIMANCLKFVDALSIGPETAYESCNFMQDFMAAFELNPPLLAPLLFRIKMAHILGYSPNLKNCGACGEKGKESYRFFAGDGVLVCKHCLDATSWRERRFSTPVLESTRKYLDFILGASPLKWARGNLLPEVQRQCGQVIDTFIQYHLGLEWRNGIFKKI